MTKFVSTETIEKMHEVKEQFKILLNEFLSLNTPAVCGALSYLVVFLSVK